jgi:hypothetical protein
MGCSKHPHQIMVKYWQYHSQRYKPPYAMVVYIENIFTSHIHTQRKQKVSFNDLPGSDSNYFPYWYSVSSFIRMMLPVSCNHFLRLNKLMQYAPQGVCFRECVYVFVYILVCVCWCVEMVGICLFVCVCVGLWREIETEKKTNPLTPVCEGFWSPKRFSYVGQGLTCKSLTDLPRVKP